MRSLIIGYGSIGQRHARLLNSLGADPGIISRRDIDHPKSWKTLEAGIAEHQPNYIVIASATSEHIEDINKLISLEYKGAVLVEKPLFHEAAKIKNHSFSQAYIAYNLRFHPVMLALKQALVGESVCSAQIYVGQYLPTWRPGTDYRQSYSAKAEQGGGVLLDLSHDLDYTNWLLGRCLGLAALGGKFGDLDISSDDVFSLMMKMENCPAVTVSLNYLDRIGRREIIINTAAKTIKADLVKGELWIDAKRHVYDTHRDETYLAMHNEILSGNNKHSCTVAEGLETLDVIEAALESAKTMKWVQR